jgi:hypothetical protein
LSTLALVLFLVFAFGGLDVAKLERATAGSADDVYGWAWSSNIGWISFNCTNEGTCSGVDYGVDFDQGTGLFSGYAWSSNIGWISFNTSDLSGCPSGTCEARLSGGVLTGWAKALAGGTVGSGGWDGWIRLSDIGGSPSYGVTLSDTQLNGFAWGDDVLGWVDFNPNVSFGAGPGGGPGSCTGVCAGTPTTPTVALIATPTVVNFGENSTLSWTSTDTDSCDASPWSLSTGISGSELVGPITTDTTYNITCTGAGGSAIDSASVTVVQPDFSLFNSNGMSISTDGGNSTETTITVSPSAGFSSDVSLTGSSSSTELSNVSYIFADSTLSSGEYASGTTLTVNSPSSIVAGAYTVTVTGTGSGLVRTVDMTLTVSVSGGPGGGSPTSPGFEEF